MGEIAKVPMVNDVEENEKRKSDNEVSFLKDAYRILQPALIDSINETTNYSPGNLSVQKGRGSSHETSAQRRSYTSLCTTNLTGQVLNMSFKYKGKKGKETVKEDTVLQASDTVIRFICGHEIFQNIYSLIYYEASLLNWKQGSTDTIAVAGGLLFPILTALLLSYRYNNGIIMIIESYGGKKRGIHQHWKYNKNLDIETINRTIQKLKEAEEKKIPFTINKAFKLIKAKWPLYLTNTTIYWGLGCDAIGKQLSTGEKSFLVCEAIQIPEVDFIRTQKTSEVFANPSVIAPKCLSAVTKDAAQSHSDSDSNSDSDSDSDGGPIRFR
jgi:hypothetical protein